MSEHVTSADIVERLVTHATLGSAPREELAWLAAHGTLELLAPGRVVSRPGVPITSLYILLSGHIVIHVDRGGGRHKVMEWRAGDVAGVLPYSRMTSPPGEAVAQEPTEVVAIPRSELSEMTRACQTVTSLLVHKMLDRARVFTSSGLQDEKMISLGKLAAGLAHELNNPTAAIERTAASLDERLEDAERAAHDIAAARLSAAQLAALDELRSSCLATRAIGTLSPIERAERDEAIADWLDDHGVESSVAGAFADTSVRVEALNRLAAAMDGRELSAALRWVAAGCSLRRLASEIQEAATRISGLVTAIKGFTHMDQATVADAVDLPASLASTVTILNSKARTQRVTVQVDVEPALPRVRGFVGELNQIWANLLDNALDAAGPAGRVEVTARRRGDRVAVSIVDNGAGIPDEIRSRVFDPFFTTKPVGKGTGLGLDIVRRLVIHNDAEIEVDSVPGRTEFRVTLPVADDGGGGIQ